VALLIADECIHCDVCEPACPDRAIGPGRSFYVIDPDRCTECVGHYAEAHCRVICPVACNVQDPQRPECREQLLAKFDRLHAVVGNR